MRIGIRVAKSNNAVQISDDLIDAAGYLHDSKFKIIQKMGDAVEALKDILGIMPIEYFDDKDSLKKSLPEQGNKLEYFRKKILEHLSKLEKEENSMSKSLSEWERLVQKAGFPVGTIRTWNGVRHIKMPDGKWRPKYDSHTRGAKMSLSILKKRIAAAKDEHEMMQLCLLNRDRFSDKNGHPLPFMQELHDYIEEQKTVRAKAARPKAQKPIEEKNPKEKSNYTGGTQQERLNRVKDDYAAGKIDFDTTIKEYMAIYPKLEREDAESTVRHIFKTPALNGKWENPLGKYDNIPPENIARTMGREKDIKAVRDPESKQKMIATLVNTWKVSKEDAESFVDNLANLPETERMKAKKYTDTIDKKKQQETEIKDDETKPADGTGLSDVEINAYESKIRAEIKNYTLSEERRKKIESAIIKQIDDLTSEELKTAYKVAQEDDSENIDKLLSNYLGAVKEGRAVRWSSSGIDRALEDSGVIFYLQDREKKKIALPLIEKEMKKQMPKTEQEIKDDEKAALVAVRKEYGEIINSTDSEAEKERKLKAANERATKEDVESRLKTKVFDDLRDKVIKEGLSGSQNTEPSNPAYEERKKMAEEAIKKQDEMLGNGETPNDLFQAIQKKYRSAKAIEGDEDEIQIGKETLSGKWKLVEADTPTASHDETTFLKTPGFPTNADGSTINDRDYGHDRAAQDAVMDIGSDFDGRALKVDNPVIITTDGIVISGNNRTMSSKIAAKKGTDTKYIEALKKRAKKFGFTPEQVEEFKNPRVVFEVKQEGNYTTEQFSKFNESGKKEMGPTEKAVKVSKLIKPETVMTVAEKIGEFETLGELYADRSAVQHIFNAFKNSGLVGEFEAGKYIENGSVTEDGKTFIETALLGSVMNESNIRGFNRPGCKSIRGMLVRAITPLIENKSMKGYSIARELNEAADIAMQVAINRDKFRSVEDFSMQQSMFEKFDPVSIELAKKMEGTQKAFAEFMQKMNGSLKYAANGEADIFLGDVETKEDILSRFLPIKKAVIDVLNSIRGLFD